jgi:hypothetical protein
MNDYADDDQRELLRAYYGESSPISVAALADVVRMVRLIAYFWTLALPAELRAENARYLSLLESGV